MAYGIAPAFIIGALVAFLRQVYFFQVALKFRAMTPETKSRRIYKCVWGDAAAHSAAYVDLVSVATVCLLQLRAYHANTQLMHSERQSAN